MVRSAPRLGVDSAAVVSVGVLGPLEVSVGGRPVALTSGRLRTLLAVLATSAGTPTSVERLADAMWGEDLPEDARRAVRVYVTRLRSALGAGAIRTCPDGYLLASDHVDAVRFVRLLDAADAAPDPAVEREHLVEALALWRGTPFEGVRSAWLEQAESPRLVERYLAALERRIDLDLAGGRHAELVASLRELTAQYPLRERLWWQLMLALYRSGRQADALEAYGRLYGLLRDELGVEPSPPVRELHQRMLTGDPALDAPDVSVPRQLPPGVGDFTGRAQVLDQLDALLPSATGGASTVVISAIAGTAGVGKTAVALHWAHRIKDRFPDGQLYVDLRGFDASGQTVQPDEAVRGFLEALGIPRQRIPADLRAQIGLYRSLMAGRRTLVVLDNARDAEQVRPLLAGAAGSLVMVTSRSQLSGLVAGHGAHPVLLDVFSGDESRQLLAERLGPDRLAAEPEATDEIIASCAQLPLALGIVAARAATHPNFPLATFAAELRDVRARLDALSSVDRATDLRAVFSWSYRALGVATARLFRLLGLHPTNDIGTPAAASLAGITLERVRPLLAELCHANLVTERAPGRFGFHDLLRAYATELAGTDDSDAERHAAVHRMLDHYLASTHAAARALNPHRDHPVVLAALRAGVTPERFDDHRQALAWVAAERAALLAGVERAAASGFDAHAGQLTWALSLFLARSGHWHEWVAAQRIALEAVERSGDRVEQTRAHRGLARVFCKLGRFDDAYTHMRHALRLYRDLRDHVGEGHTYIALGEVYERQGRPDEALRHAQQGLVLLRKADDPAGVALALNAVGWCHAQLGDYRQALVHCRQALDLQRQLGDRFGEATTWDSLGFAHRRLADHREAATCYQRALALRHDDGDRYAEATTLMRLGDTHRDAGDEDAAQRAWQQAAAILDELDHPDVDEVRVRLGRREPHL